MESLSAINTDGDRLIIESLLQRKRYPVTGSYVVLEGISVCDLPRMQAFTMYLLLIKTIT
jgi:hypothetical protein